jgi:hypothetical protein
MGSADVSSSESEPANAAGTTRPDAGNVDVLLRSGRLSALKLAN